MNGTRYFYLRDSPLNDAFFSIYNLLVAGHGASDLHPKIQCCDKLQKQSVLQIIQLNFTIM